MRYDHEWGFEKFSGKFRCIRNARPQCIARPMLQAPTNANGMRYDQIAFPNRILIRHNLQMMISARATVTKEGCDWENKRSRRRLCDSLGGFGVENPFVIKPDGIECEITRPGNAFISFL